MIQLPTDVIQEIIERIPSRWTQLRLSRVNWTLRFLTLPHTWKKQSIDVQKAEWLIDNPFFAGMIRIASIMPSNFFGSDDDPPRERDMYTLRNLFSSLANLSSLTIPLPDHTPTFNLLRTSSFSSIRFTHAQPTPQSLRRLATTRSDLKDLQYAIYPAESAIWILGEEALESYAQALANFPELCTVDLCASVHCLQPLPTGLEVVLEGQWAAIEDISDPASSTPEAISDAQRRATLVLATHNANLQSVVWSDPRRHTLDVWTWRVVRDVGDANKPVDAVCLGMQKRIATWDQTWHDMGNSLIRAA